MNPTYSHRIKSAKARLKAAYAAQTVVVDPHWKIVRIDDRNWQIQLNGEDKGFFGSISSALRALPDKMLDLEARESVQKVLEAARRIEKTVEVWRE